MQYLEVNYDNYNYDNPHLDLHREFTIPFVEYLTDEGKGVSSQLYKLLDFAEAIEVIRKVIDVYDLQTPPYICYNPVSDDFFYIFKINNNGVAFFVGNNIPMPMLDK
jgi:hypothetical protein